MKIKTTFLVFVFIFSTSMFAKSQFDISDIEIHETKGKEFHFVHLDSEKSAIKGSRIQKGAVIGKISIPPKLLSNRWDQNIQRSMELYNSGNYKEAANVLNEPYSKESNNHFIANSYARALYQVDRNKSYEVYKKLVNQLHAQAPNKNMVVIDMWFPEAYWKLGSLHLDNKKYKEAAKELSIFIEYLRIVSGASNKQLLGMAFQYLTETYYNMYQDSLAAYYAQITKVFDPSNEYASGVLNKLSLKK